MTICAPSVYVKHTGTTKGRGAFAARAHTAGELVESSPVILLSNAYASIPQEVRSLLFNWGVLASSTNRHCLALGYGSMYNHGNPSNMRYEADPTARVLRFIAVRDIAADEELTVNYNAAGGSHRSDGDTWFQGMGIDVFRVGAPEEDA